jgi:long-subunit acyl-CoA synthetase (AMP-forming)
MTAFPNVAFQNLMCGVPSVLPRANSAEIWQQIQDYNIASLSGPPAFYEKLLATAEESKQPIPIKGLLIGGAPVNKNLAEKINTVFSSAQAKLSAFIVYGSTEVEPISFIELQTIIDSNYSGFLVGKPLEEVELKIETETGAAEEGEIWLSGPHVVERYFNNTRATDSTKTRDINGKLWHRTGDWGRLTKNGEILLTGRAPDLIRTENSILPNYTIEAELNQIPGIRRAGVIMSSNQKIEICLEAVETDIHNRHEIQSSQVEKTLSKFQLGNYNINWLQKIPTDPRHQSRVNRAALRKLIKKPVWF